MSLSDVNRRRFLWNHPKNSHTRNFGHREEKDGQTDTPRKWRCGNPKRSREVVSNFAQSSSVHGAAYVCSTGGRGSSLCSKIIYGVLFTICAVFVIISIVSLLQENFSKQSTFINSINRDMETGYEGDPEYFPLYPRVTICRRPPYRTDFNASYLQFVEYVMLSLGFPFISLNKSEMFMVLKLAAYDVVMKKDLHSTEVEFRERFERLEERYRHLKKSESYDLRRFISDHSVNCSNFFSSCFIFIYPMDCCLLFASVLTSDGQCFTVPDISVFTYILRAKPLDVFSFVIDLVSPPTLDHQNAVGFRVFLSDSSEDVHVHFDQSTGQDVVPGSTTTIKANLIKTQRTALHTPWHGLWDTCPRWSYNASYDSDRYSYSICDQQLDILLLREKCGCEPLLYYSGPSTKRLCEPIDMYKCSMQVAVKEDEKGSLSACKQPCRVYTYKTESSYMGMGGDRNISRVEIMYNVKQFTYNEYRKTTISGLFSQIGGSLGLYLGASIITLVEILIFSITWLWYRLAPAKVANITAPSSFLHRERTITRKSENRTRDSLIYNKR